ncbi:unnamed protein product (macronuclear) [Paramecium tetraurelia]|uniref:Chromosome undetermined scaffold_138, whole genome shotgun sequence n=1 Tax=Paramecium tetraurelia TaxID=5888 RepID=Q3SDQ3_PARTE|nr:uncharacterized protein GSPATT00033601001 [Paramecium tetraurelia]CAI39305.1 rab_C42 [Paramecium tetraurelia]CAK63748.1 unnamed protein product [Paramecium tetraurelia]|eukprot:XP_001431146.1 hypothetical protein (macronuclear) [Paramecium tetraurelia strain d4-2]
MQKIEQEKFQHQIKILFLGDTDTGKTTLLLKYVTGKFDPSQTTIGVDFKYKSVGYQGKMIRIQIWDTAGQERYRSINQTQFKNANCFFFFYDITNQKPFEEVLRLLNDVEQLASPDVIKILIGNKIDLNSNRKVSYDKGKQFAQENRLEFFETSVLQDRILEDPINYVLEQFLKQKELEQKQNIQKNQINVALSNQIVPMLNKKTKQFDQILKIILLGDNGIGKSSLYQKYCFQTIISTTPTIGVDCYDKIVEFQGKKLKIILWDTSGQEAFMPIVQPHCNNANSVFFIYNITSKDTFQGIIKWINLAKKSASRNTINVLIGNKIDLNSSRQVSSTEGQQLAQDLKLKFYETSARYDNPLEDPINYVLEQFLKLNEKQQIQSNQKTVQIENRNQSLSCNC